MTLSFSILLAPAMCCLLPFPALLACSPTQLVQESNCNNQIATLPQLLSSIPPPPSPPSPRNSQSFITCRSPANTEKNCVLPTSPPSHNWAHPLACRYEWHTQQHQSRQTHSSPPPTNVEPLLHTHTHRPSRVLLRNSHGTRRPAHRTDHSHGMPPRASR